MEVSDHKNSLLTTELGEDSEPFSQSVHLCSCSPSRLCKTTRRRRTLTLRLLGDGHAQPLHVGAVLAADAGGPAAKGMEGDGAHDQRQLQTELGCTRDVNAHLLVGGGENCYLVNSSISKASGNTVPSMHRKKKAPNWPWACTPLWWCGTAGWRGPRVGSWWRDRATFPGYWRPRCHHTGWPPPSASVSWCRERWMSASVWCRLWEQWTWR